MRKLHLFLAALTLWLLSAPALAQTAAPAGEADALDPVPHRGRAMMGESRQGVAGRGLGPRRSRSDAELRALGAERYYS